MMQCIFVHENTEGLKGLMSSKIVKYRNLNFHKRPVTSHNSALHRLVNGWNMKIALHEQFGNSTFTEGVTEYCDMNAMHIL